MSGVGGTGAGLSSAIRTATPLTPSSGPGQSPLTIGSVIFNTEECPEDLPIGAVKQMNVTDTLPGGTRIVNLFGPDPQVVAWKGRLYAGNVDTRIQQLRLYAVSGQVTLLAWRGEQYNVFVSSITPHYHHQWYAEYDIEVIVVSDANGAFTIPSGLSIDQQVQGLQTMMLEQNNIIFQFDPTNAAAINDSLPAVVTAIQNAGPLATASASNVQLINAAINNAQLQVSKYTSALQNIAPGLAPQLSASLQLGSTLTNIAANVNRGQQTNSQIVQGGNLFAVAAQHYGDPTQAFSLATANGILSPWLTKSQQQTLVLPPLPSSQAANN